MLDNAEIQNALVTYAKTRTNITSSLLDANEIREDQWQGVDFTYPNIRLRLISNVPMGEAKECHQARCRMSWLVFSQESNSREADQICGKIYDELHRKMFSASNILFSMLVLDIIPAVRIDERTWRAEVLMESIVSG